MYKVRRRRRVAVRRFALVVPGGRGSIMQTAWSRSTLCLLRAGSGRTRVGLFFYFVMSMVVEGSGMIIDAWIEAEPAYVLDVGF